MSNRQGQPTDWPIDWDAIREELAQVRALAAALVHTGMDLVARIDHIDPTPGSLAAAADHTAHRR